MRNIVLILFITTLNHAVAQTDFREGFVIKTTNDTIYGLIDYRGNQRNSQICRFKENETFAEVEYLPGEISAYRFNDGKYYVSKLLTFDKDERILFIEYVLDGIADLYYFQDANGDNFLIEKEDGSQIRLENPEVVVKDEYGVKYLHKSKKYVGQLKVAFKEHAELHPSLDNMAFKLKPLIEATRKYHEYVCSDQECIIFEKKPPTFKAIISPVVRYEWTTMTTNYSEKYSPFKFTGYSVSAGAAANINVPALSEKAWFEFALLVGKTELNSNFLKPVPPFTYDYSLHLEFVHVKNDISLKYVYPKGRLRPTLGAGYSSVYSISREKREHMDRYLNEKFIESRNGEIDIPMRKYHVGGHIGPGLQYYFRNGQALHIRAAYQAVFDFLSPDRNMKYTSFTLQAGMTLNK